MFPCFKKIILHQNSQYTTSSRTDYWTKTSQQPHHSLCALSVLISQKHHTAAAWNMLQEEMPELSI